MPRPGRFIPGKEKRYSLYRRLGEPHGWSGRVRKVLPSPGFDSADRPARSGSLYRLNCPRLHYGILSNINHFIGWGRILGFVANVDRYNLLFEIFALLGCYAASSDNFLSTFRCKLSAPNSRIRQSQHLKMGPIICPEASVINYHYSLRNDSEERSSHLLRGGSLKSLMVLKLFCFTTLTLKTQN